MENNGTSRPYSESAGSESPPKELSDAQELAGQLEQLLRQEAKTLRRFDNQGLLTILHQKESLIRELAEKLSDLEKAKHGRAGLTRTPRYLSLKARLKEVDKLNRSNKAFIEGSLSHCQQFINCVCPSGYHPNRLNMPRQQLAAFKGMSFKKEI